MKRKPVAVTSHVYGDCNQFTRTITVCNDGSVWEYDADRDNVWTEAPSIPGTVRAEDHKNGTAI